MFCLYSEYVSTVILKSISAIIYHKINIHIKMGNSLIPSHGSLKEYNGKTIIGVSGSRGHCVDELTFHYRDGSKRTVGANGGDVVKEQKLEKYESIVQVKWDRLIGSHLGRGFEFVLNSGRSINVEGSQATWLRYNVVVYSNEMVLRSSVWKIRSFLADIIYHYEDISLYNCPAVMVWQYVWDSGSVHPAAKASTKMYFHFSFISMYALYILLLF